MTVGCRGEAFRLKQLNHQLMQVRVAGICKGLPVARGKGGKRTRQKHQKVVRCTERAGEKQQRLHRCSR